VQLTRDVTSFQSHWLSFTIVMVPCVYFSHIIMSSASFSNSVTILATIHLLNVISISSTNKRHLQVISELLHRIIPIIAMMALIVTLGALKIQNWN